MALRELGLRRTGPAVAGARVAVVIQARARAGVYALRGTERRVGLWPDLMQWPASASSSKPAKWRGDKLDGHKIALPFRRLINAMYPRAKWHISEDKIIDITKVSSRYAMVFAEGKLVAMVSPMQ